MTTFEWRVLEATMAIPFGQTRSYKWVAQRIGRPKAARAVGTALRNNPYPVAIPCHRVVKSDGTLGRYAGKADGTKSRMLNVEQQILSVLKKPDAARR